MPVSSKTDAVISQPYYPPVGYGMWEIPQQLIDELRRIAICTDELIELLPQMTDVAPSDPRVGTLRQPQVAEWDPLGFGVDQMVYWDGTAWLSTTRAAVGTWEIPFRIGETRLWTDGSGDLRRNTSDPANDTDGTVI
jgi:hypothetical protein